MKSILTISNNDQGISWGPAVHYLELWNAVAKQTNRFDIEGFVPSWTNHPFIKKADLKITVIKVPNIPKLRQMIFDLRTCLKILLSKSKIIYIRLSQFHVFSIIALKLTATKPIIELNGILEDDAISAGKSSGFQWFVKTQERLLIRQASAVIAVSHNIAKKATQVGAKNVFTIKNGVSENFYAVQQRQRNPDDALVVIYVGTFTPWDGAIYIPKLAHLFPDIKFLMIGDGAGRKKLEAESPSNMEYLGYVEYSKLPKYLSQADAGIVLYEEERHKNVELSSLKTLEYMAAGLAIFTTDVPGQEFIAQNRIGKTVHFNNLEDEFRDFLCNIELYKKNAENYRQTQGKKFGWNETARLTIEIMNSLTQSRKKQ